MDWVLRYLTYQTMGTMVSEQGYCGLRPPTEGKGSQTKLETLAENLNLKEPMGNLAELLVFALGKAPEPQKPICRTPKPNPPTVRPQRSRHVVAVIKG